MIEERLLNENSEFNVELVDLKKLREALIEETNEVVSKVVQTDDLDGIEMLKLNLFHTQESFNECLIEPGFYETGYSISR